MERLGHRGAPSLATENTLPSFAAAVRLGVDAVELDVQLSADGRLMVIHDDTVDRTMPGSGRVADMDSADLLALGVPTFASVLGVLADHCGLTCELKGPGTGPPAVAHVNAAGLSATTVFTSFDLDRVTAVKAAQPALRVGGISGRADDELLERLLALGAELADIHWAALTPGWVESAHAAGLRVRACTVNDEAALAHALAAGVDGIMSDRPDWLLSALASAAQGT
ncbi:MAG: glycerophosphodiester phosphodiesterase [Armatimonadetes bacterium]|nr:glycerophosphodiester phosphodiesterase [Armatimonadota bacterium]